MKVKGVGKNHQEDSYQSSEEVTTEVEGRSKAVDNLSRLELP